MLKMGQNVRQTGLNKVLLAHISKCKFVLKQRNNVNGLQECRDGDFYTLVGPTLSYIHTQVTSQTGSWSVPVKDPGGDNFGERTLEELNLKGSSSTRGSTLEP